MVNFITANFIINNFQYMEGFNRPIEKMRPTSEPLEGLGRKEKIAEAEINVAEMFKKMMGTDKNIVERLIAEGRPSFSGPEERRF